MSELCCKKCQSFNYTKSGHIRGLQRCRCKDCGYQFTKTKRRGVHPALKSFAIVLYAFCGVSMGKIAQLFKVSTVAVLKWIRAAALSAETSSSVASSDVVMIDEMWHFVNGKNKIWLWRAIDGVSRESLGWQLGSRGYASCKKLIAKVDTGTCSFITDE